MGTKHLSIWLLLLLSGSSVFLLTGCPGECISTTYSFQATALVSPQKEFLKVGDTLWVESSTSTTFHDASSGNDVDFSHAENVGSGLRISQLVADTNTLVDAVQDFDLTMIHGAVSPPHNLYPNRARDFLYEEKDGKYQFKVQMICRKQGIYNLAISSAANVYRKTSGSCGRADIFITFSNPDKHLHYLQELYYKDQPIDEISKTNCYGFVVQ